RVAAERFQIVDRDHSAGFGAAVAIAHWNSQLVEKLQRFGFGEGAADEKGAQLAAEGLMDLWKEGAADFQMRATSRQCAVRRDQCIQDFALAGGQIREALAQATF